MASVFHYRCPHSALEWPQSSNSNEKKTKANTMAPEFVVVVCLWFRQQRSFHWLLSASPFLFVLARSPDAVECASKWEATPLSHAWHHQLPASSLLLEMPLSQHPFLPQGGTDTLEKGPAEWNSPFWLQLGIVTWLIWGLSEMKQDQHSCTQNKA